MRAFKQSIILGLVLLFSAGSLAVDGEDSAPESKTESKSRLVNVSILFDYVGFKEKINLYEVPPERILDVGDSKTLPMAKEFPFSKKLPLISKLRRGEVLPFAMVVENNTDDPMYFYSTPHTMKPEENALGYQLFCLCIHKIFMIPPKSRWYRVGSISLQNTFMGEVIAVNHSIIGLTADEIARKKLGKLIVR